MDSILYNCDQMKNQKTVYLPNKFKWVALGIFILGCMMSLLAFLKILPIEKETIGLIMKQVTIISLVILAGIRLKKEDELTIAIRSQTFVATLFFIVMMILLDPLINYYFDGTYNFIDGHDPYFFIGSGLFSFQLIFRLSLRRR